MKKFKIIRLHRNKRTFALMFVLAVFISTFFFYFYHPHKASAQVFITSGTSWTVPSDWSNLNNSIDVVGGGGGGGGGTADSGTGYGGGGGGGFSTVTNVTLVAGSTVTIAIGAAGSGGATGGNNGTPGSDTYLCSATTSCSSITDTNVIVGAKGGAEGTVAGGGAGGAAASGIGATKLSGGAGGGVAGGGGGNAGGGGGGGGGAGGPSNNGATGSSGSTGSGNTGGGGGAGGAGDGANGGAGGAASAANAAGGNGGNGTEYDSTHGSGGAGGGGGGGDRNVAGGAGGTAGLYGSGGGGGGGGGRSNPGGAGTAGRQGLIRVVYTSMIQSDYRWRLDNGNETTGSSLAAQDTAASINYGTNVRLRVVLIGIGSDTTFSYRLEYSRYQSACDTSWTAVPVSAGSSHFNIFNSSNITDQGATTNAASGPAVITDPAGYTFRAGKFVNNTSNTAASQTIEAGKFTELEYAIQANSNATYGSYCFRVTTSSGTPLDSYTNYPILNVNYPPSTPTISSVVDGTTNVPRLPMYQLRSSDVNYDDLKYVVEVCPANSWPCASGGHTYDQTSSQTCWSEQNAASGTAFRSDALLYNSTMAYCQTPVADLLSPNTTYYMRAKAIDPSPGSAIYSSYSTVVSFTSSALDIQILGGTCIGGTGSTCASGSGTPVTDVKIGG